MMWLTWRQFRAQTIAAGTVLIALAIALVVSGVGLGHAASDAGLTTCQAHDSCQTAAASFITALRGGAYELVFFVCTGIMFVAPALMGTFWGAPLIAREVEGGTLGLAWTQSVTRTRWLAVKLGLVGLAAVGTAGLLSLMTGWWTRPIYHAAALYTSGPSVVDRFNPGVFGSVGVVPLGYAAFAFALGVTAGLLIRRTIPAMAVVLAVFAFVQIAWPSWVRPHLMAPVRQVLPLHVRQLDEVLITDNTKMIVGASVSKPGAWVIANQTIGADGQPFTGPPTKACLGNGIQACNASIARLHLRQVVTFQPASRFWAFQWYETAIFVVLALALAGFGVWRISRRRLT